jgi:hypothetical protein
MTPQEYQDQGYKLSANVSQTQINQAEEDVKVAYIVPSIGSELPEVMTDAQRNAVMALAFLRLSQNNMTVTRSGAKAKNVAESSSVWLEQGLQEQARRCHFYLLVLQKQAGQTGVKLDDICGIYFKTNFFYD